MEGPRRMHDKVVSFLPRKGYGGQALELEELLASMRARRFLSNVECLVYGSRKRPLDPLGRSRYRRILIIKKWEL